MNYDELINLINIVNCSNLTFFELQLGETRITLKKENSIEKYAKKEIACTIIPKKAINKIVYIKCELVGIYYDLAELNLNKTIVVGDKVKKGQILCFVESLRIMNRIYSECDGVVKEICVKNQQLVEYGQILMKIEAT